MNSLRVLALVGLFLALSAVNCARANVPAGDAPLLRTTDIITR